MTRSSSPPSPTCARRIDAVTGLDADRILRSFLAMIMATLRTNWFRDRPFFSFKIDPSQVPGMPAPRPRFEIFVYSPRVEGVHLRFGAVARGGLRWSDRPQDYRTEILGLVKAQAVKNAVIVPVGAKGGFVVARRAAPGPAEVEACYRTFISGLLDVTDNLVDGKIVPPPDVVRHDGDDSYLVVAADKGTATFSDIANEVADVVRVLAGRRVRLRRLGRLRPQGDGDHREGRVGERQAALPRAGRRHADRGVHRRRRRRHVRRRVRQRHAALARTSGCSRRSTTGTSSSTPNPDAATSFAERERMFALPRSSWDDYDRSLISAGGGVWPRTAKSVPVGPEMRAALGHRRGRHGAEPARADRGHPARARPTCCGTAASAPTSRRRPSRTPTRATRPTTPCGSTATSCASRWWARAATSALTQRGRIEFARAGGKINTDAIDNSAGVDCSDHEVNIKILLDRLVAAAIWSARRATRCSRR